MLSNCIYMTDDIPMYNSYKYEYGELVNAINVIKFMLKQ